MTGMGSFSSSVRRTCREPKAPGLDKTGVREVALQEEVGRCR